jgi:hypothetical protein
MVRGWVSRDVYATHFDPKKWPVTEEASRKSASGALADAAVSAPKEDA